VVVTSGRPRRVTASSSASSAYSPVGRRRRPGRPARCRAAAPRPGRPARRPGRARSAAPGVVRSAPGARAGAQPRRRRREPSATSEGSGTRSPPVRRGSRLSTPGRGSSSRRRVLVVGGDLGLGDGDERQARVGDLALDAGRRPPRGRPCRRGGCASWPRGLLLGRGGVGSVGAGDSGRAGRRRRRRRPARSVTASTSTRGSRSTTAVTGRAPGRRRWRRGRDGDAEHGALPAVLAADLGDRAAELRCSAALARLSRARLPFRLSTPGRCRSTRATP
jgi:hypothetical protein